MFDQARQRLSAVVRRVRQFERRELRDLHRWLEDTHHLVLLSVLVAIPVTMGFLTFLANRLELLPFLLFPPVASGAYTLFSQPGSRYASPRRFVGGLTIGAASGWIALEITARYWYQVPPESFSVHPGAAAFGLLLTGLVTWVLDLEESQSFSTALLVLVTGANQLVFVASVFVSSLLVAGVFVVWRRELYSRRSEFLYGTVQTDDQILVPVRGDESIDAPVADFAAQLAGAHPAGKVVLLDVVDAEARTTDANPGAVDHPVPPAARAASSRLKGKGDRLEERYGVHCEVLVAAVADDEAATVVQAASEASCDLIAVPYETDETAADRVSPFLRTLLKSDHDVVALRPSDGEDWRRLLVPVRRDGEVAHAMVDFAQRLAGRAGHVTVCHCIERERQRPGAETMLGSITEQFERALETRVAVTSVQTFLDENCGHYDLTFIGASSDRSAASRVLSPPTFQKLQQLDCSYAVVHVG